MQKDSSSILQAVTDKIAALQSERATLLARIQEIDEQLGKAARSLGLDIGINPLGRLPLEDARVAGSMTERMMSILFNADRGYTKLQLRDALRSDPDFSDQMGRNPNAFYNNVSRYLKLNKMVEVNGLLYHPDRAPQVDGEPPSQPGLRLVGDRDLDL